MTEHQDDLRAGLWRYCPEKMALLLDGSSRQDMNPTYHVELARLSTSGQLLDMILQLHSKGEWSKEHQAAMGMYPDFQVTEFITLVDMLCRKFLKTNIQGAFSASGEHRSIDWEKLAIHRLG